jgi:hypothetical protein
VKHGIAAFILINDICTVCDGVDRFSETVWQRGVTGCNFLTLNTSILLSVRVPQKLHPNKNDVLQKIRLF